MVCMVVKGRNYSLTSTWNHHKQDAIVLSSGGLRKLNWQLLYIHHKPHLEGLEYNKSGRLLIINTAASTEHSYGLVV